MLKRSSPPPLPKSVYRTIFPQFLFEKLCTENLFWRIQCIFMQCTCVCSFPYSTVLTINVSTQVEQCFVRKKQNVEHMKPLLWRNLVVNYRITWQLLTNRTEARHWMKLWWTSQHMLEVSIVTEGKLLICASIYRCLIFWLHLIRYTLYFLFYICVMPF
jgi:hypothetical protein